jgi:molybdopterin synthase catalytic subunit
MGNARVQSQDFDAAAEARALVAGRVDVGAVVVFVGLCRDEGGRLAALEIEHYPGMAEAEIARVVAAAEARWPLIGVTVIHRYGTLAPGAQIVLVAVAAAHRREAFEAAEMLMDYLKSQAPFWKRARLRDGSVEPWVEAEASDDRAAARWRAGDRP